MMLEYWGHKDKNESVIHKVRYSILFSLQAYCGTFT